MKSRIRKLISLFVLAVVLTVFLDGIICEVDKLVFDVLEIELLGWCSDVSGFVPVAFDDTIDRCDKEVMSDVEFSVVV